MSAECNILLISDQQPIVEQLKGILNEYQEVNQIAYKELKTELDRLAPDLVFLVQTDEDISIDAVEYIHSINPLITIVFIAFQQDFNLLRNVTRVGVSDFFILPDELSMFYGRIESIVQMTIDQKKQVSETATTVQSFKRGRGQIISFYSGKGGSGRTLISSSFAQTLKFESTAQVLLLDLNLQYGGIETYLSIESNRSLTDLLPVMDELSESHIRNVSEREKYSKLEVLLSPKDAEIAEGIQDGFIAKLLRTCRRSYDFVIVDLPVNINEHTYTALEESDKIYYVLNLDTPSITMLKQVGELFRRLGIETNNRLELVLNQVGKENEIVPKDIKNIVDYPINVELPRDFKGVQQYINKSEPLRKEPNEKRLIPFSKEVRKWILKVID